MAAISVCSYDKEIFSPRFLMFCFCQFWATGDNMPDRICMSSLSLMSSSYPVQKWSNLKKKSNFDLKQQADMITPLSSAFHRGDLSCFAFTISELSHFLWFLFMSNLFLLYFPFLLFTAALLVCPVSNQLVFSCYF